MEQPDGSHRSRKELYAQLSADNLKRLLEYLQAVRMVRCSRARHSTRTHSAQCITRGPRPRTRARPQARKLQREPPPPDDRLNQLGLVQSLLHEVDYIAGSMPHGAQLAREARRTVRVPACLASRFPHRCLSARSCSA